MNYYWTDCPGCRGQLTFQWTVSADRAVGSVRRWSADRTVNDGRRFDAPAPGGAFAAACVCGTEIAVPGPAAVGGNRASA